MREGLDFLASYSASNWHGDVVAVSNEIFLLTVVSKDLFLNVQPYLEHLASMIQFDLHIFLRCWLKFNYLSMILPTDPGKIPQTFPNPNKERHSCINCW